MFKLKCLLIALTSAALEAAACEPGSLAVQYIEAIEARSADQMSNYMATDIHYQDPTMAYFNIPAIDIHGKKATEAFWRDSFGQAHVQQMHYTIQHCFQAGPVTMLELEFTMRVAGANWGVNKDVVELTTTHMMSLNTSGDGKNERILHQVDYVDYAKMTQQIEHFKQQFGASN